MPAMPWWNACVISSCVLVGAGVIGLIGLIWLSIRVENDEAKHHDTTWYEPEDE